MKKLIILIPIMGISLFFNACAPAYVDTTPTYREMPKPPRPTVNHIWINDDWRWQRQNRTYIQRNGYWVVPSRGRVYVPGYWQTRPRGNHWVPGRWR
jgi:WXXGXW repeat (2 copies)